MIVPKAQAPTSLEDQVEYIRNRGIFRIMLRNFPQGCKYISNDGGCQKLQPVPV